MRCCHDLSPRKTPEKQRKDDVPQGLTENFQWKTENRLSCFLHQGERTGSPVFTKQALSWDPSSARCKVRGDCCGPCHWHLYSEFYAPQCFQVQPEKLVKLVWSAWSRCLPPLRSPQLQTQCAPLGHQLN